MSEEKQLKRIADALEKSNKVFDNPEEFADRLSNVLQNVLSRVNMPAPVLGAPSVAIGTQVTPDTVAVTSVEVKLSEEERKAICEKAMADIEENMAEFKGFIGQAFSELPEPALKRIGELMEKGEKFKLRRRHGCIYLDFGHGDDDFYLRM